MTRPTLVQLDQELVRRRGLYGFVRLAWPIVDPSPFVPNWHLEEVCLHLEAVSRDQIRKLIVNVPPGTGKSLLVSVFWPAWEWIERPQTAWMFASYDAGLVARDADKMIKLLRSDWFGARWGDRLPGDAVRLATSDFTNQWGGFRFSTSVKGKGTGRHADIRVVDDPIKPQDALGGGTVTKAALEEVKRWHANTWSTRIRDPERAREVVVMQRLHTEDLAGHLLATGSYTHLCLPMRADLNELCRTPVGGDRRTEPGELLFPKRYSEAAVADLEERLGPNAAAQLQQRPVRAGGAIFREEWFRTWDVLPREGYWLQSWDLTFKGTDGSDFVAGGVWLMFGENFYLVHLVNRRMSFTQTVNAIRHVSALYPQARDKLVEDTANGPAVADALRSEVDGLILVPPLGGKEARANAVSGLFASGRVFLPPEDQCPEIRAYRAQLTGFPRASNDDMVDMSTQALVRLRSQGDRFRSAMARIRQQGTT